MSKLRWLVAVGVMLLGLPLQTAAQARGTVTGVVTDQATRAPVQGAQVVIAGTTIGTLTDQQGRFTLSGVPVGTRTVQVSRAGYRTASRQAVVGSEPVELTFTLQQDLVGLDELVVIGYGEARRREVAGAVSTLRTDAVTATIPTATIDNVLQGRVAGVQVTQNSGTPGAAITVRVRGSSSISAGNQPLYVVDGVPVIQGNYSQINATFGGQGIDALGDLNPADIESIQVLKDASAAAIYGSRASNGVVLITTKRGRAGRAEINVNTYYGTQSAWRTPQMLNAAQFREVYNETLGEAFDLTVDDLFAVGDSTADVDWLDEVLSDAPIRNLDVQVRGGTERTRYFVSGTAFDQGGIVADLGYQRLSGRINLDYEPTDRLTLSSNVQLTRAEYDRGRNDNTIYGAFANAIAAPPVEPVFNEDGSYNLDTWYANPVALMRENEAEERSLRVLGNTAATLTLLEGFSLRGSAGVDQYTLRSRLYDSPVVGLQQGVGGGTAASSASTKLNAELTLNFDRDLSAANRISGVVGTGYETNNDDFTSASGSGFPGEQFRYLTSAAVVSGGSNSVTEWSLVSFFGRLTYNLSDQLITTFNIRTDGSSRFGENNRYGTFPSVSTLWQVGDMPFMQNQSLFSNLALRASYGRTGNQQGIGNFASLGLFGAVAYNDRPGLAPTQLANPDLKWETTDQLNVGTDFALLDERLSLSLDYYVKKTNDLLVTRPIPSTSGFTVITSNIGAMENRGFELAARGILARNSGRGFNWSVDFNASRNKNKVTELLNDEPINAGFASRVEVGQPLGVFYGWVTDGIFQSEAEVRAHATQPGAASGDIRFKDINGRDANGELTGQPDGVINADDRTIIGNPWPEWEGGVTNALSWRGIDLSAFVQFSLGNDVYNAMRVYTDAFGSGGDNNSIRALDRWRPDNPNTQQPRAVWGDPNQNTRDSDRFVEDGSYVRLKNLVIGYTLPESLNRRLGYRRLRLYVQGQNLWTATDYSGFDPEVNYAGNTGVTRGTDFYTLPQTRTITVGANIGF